MNFDAITEPKARLIQYAARMEADAHMATDSAIQSEIHAAEQRRNAAEWRKSAELYREAAAKL